jgi:hypothetical protein
MYELATLDKCFLETSICSAAISPANTSHCCQTKKFFAALSDHCKMYYHLENLMGKVLQKMDTILKVLPVAEQLQV